MMASAVRSYVNRFAVTPGRRIALFTNNDDGWRTAKILAARGIEIAVIIDSRAEPPAQASADARAARIITGGLVTGTKASSELAGITVQTSRGVEKVAADTLAISGGWNPDIGLGLPSGHAPGLG